VKVSNTTQADTGDLDFLEDLLNAANGVVEKFEAPILTVSKFDARGFVNFTFSEKMLFP